MLNLTRRQLRKKRHETASGEIKKLTESIDRLALQRKTPPRVRLALRVYEHVYRRGSLLTRLYGMLAGFWLMMPFTFIFDTSAGSLRSVLAALAHAANYKVDHASNSADLVVGVLRIAIGVILALAYYAVIGVGPIILGFRVGFGYPGIRVPGRRVINNYRRFALVYYCYTILVACADAIGSTGDRRNKILHEVANKVERLRSELRHAHRFTKGRRRRRGVVRAHSLRVAAYLNKIEESMEEMTDTEIMEFGGTILVAAERYANGQYGSVIEEEKLAAVEVPEREALRLAVTALMAITFSAISLYAIDALKLSSTLEPIAISASVLVSALVGYGKKAVEKVGVLRGMVGQ